MDLGSFLGPHPCRHAALGTGSGSDAEREESLAGECFPASLGSRLAVTAAVFATALACVLIGTSPGARPYATRGHKELLVSDLGSVISAAGAHGAGLSNGTLPAALAEVVLDATASITAIASTTNQMLGDMTEETTHASNPASTPAATETTTVDPWWNMVPSHSHVQASSTPAPQPPAVDWFDLLAGGDGAGIPLAPRASMHDGNICGDDEEIMNELCYKKCGTLTFGEYPVRTSAWTCCKRHPCTYANTKHNMGMCSGFDIAGDSQGDNACPHLPGACLVNEELYMGMCYKKCSGMVPDFPNRAGVGTCCKTTGFKCTLPEYGTTSSGFAVGGGDGTSASQHVKPHLPLAELTESTR